jgi:hypothetical protein
MVLHLQEKEEKLAEMRATLSQQIMQKGCLVALANEFEGKSEIVYAMETLYDVLTLIPHGFIDIAALKHCHHCSERHFNCRT